MKPWLGLTTSTLLALSLSGCMQSTQPASISSLYEYNQQYYVVQPGDTLNGIAAVFGLSAEQLAHINQLPSPYVVRPGQRLTLSATPGQQAVKPTAKVATPVAYEESGFQVVQHKPTHTAKHVSTKNRHRKHASSETHTQSTTKHHTQSKPKKTIAKRTKTVEKRTSGFAWRRPVSGKVMQSFSASKHKKLELYAKTGSTVKSSASGQVAFVGKSISGYGNLIIIKHPNNYLSAYGNLGPMSVKEGQSIKMGQSIAKVGDSGGVKRRLIFEVRHNGSAVNPVAYLPRS